MGDSSAMISSNGTGARGSLTCPNYNYLNLAGFPTGVRFNPSDQEIIEHLESMVLVKEGEGSRAHPLINHFIPTIEGDNDICYTHPENLPGVTRDGHSKHFFHRTSKAFLNGKRKRRKIMSSNPGQRSSKDVVKVYWHKTGNTHPVIVGGKPKGCKKILILQIVKQGKKPEKTNWVMHQYHLSVNEEKDGEEVVSKVFYRCPDPKMIEQKDEKVETALEATPNILTVSSAAAVTAATTVTMVQQPPAKMFQEAVVEAGDKKEVHGNNHHIPLQHLVQSVHMEPDNSFSVQVGGVGDQGQVHGNNHHAQVALAEQQAAALRAEVEALRAAAEVQRAEAEQQAAEFRVKTEAQRAAIQVWKAEAERQAAELRAEVESLRVRLDEAKAHATDAEDKVQDLLARARLDDEATQRLREERDALRRDVTAREADLAAAARRDISSLLNGAHVHSVDSEPDTTLTLGLGTGW